MTRSKLIYERKYYGSIVGVQLANGDVFVGELVKSTIDYVWVKVKEIRKPLDIPRVTIDRMFISLPEEVDGERDNTGTTREEN